METQMRREYAKMIAKAWTDSDFKARLMQDPASVFKENGIVVSDDMVSSFSLPNPPVDLIIEASSEISIIVCPAG